MNTMIKVAVAAGGGALLAEYIEPKLIEIAKPQTDFARKAAKGAAVAAGAAGIYWALGKVG